MITKENKMDDLEIKGNIMKPFNKQAMQILINHETDLFHYFENNTDTTDTIENRLKQVFLAYVCTGDEILQKKYDKFVLDDSLLPDSSLVAEIRRLVTEYGWSEFLNGIRIFCEKKAKQNIKLGLPSRAEGWLAAKDKIAIVRKTVEM